MSDAASSLSLVVPCFDEAARLDADAFLRAARAHPELRLCFVDDGSRDATGERLDALAAELPERIAVLHLGRNLGKGEAVRAGLRAELGRGARWLGFWDADLATPLDFAWSLAEHLETHPELVLAAGSRILMLGRSIERRSWRHYLGRVAATLVSNLVEAPVYDSQCGAKLFRNDARLAALLERPFVSRWLFDVEILLRIARSESGPAAEVLHRRVHEVPLTRWTDVAGSKIGIADLLALPADLWRIRRASR